jgi:hypothetical protein
MAFKRHTISHKCSKCGRTGTMTYEEEDQSGKTTRWVETSGSYRLGADGKPVCVCGELV